MTDEELDVCTECGKECDNLTVVDDETRVCDDCLDSEFTQCDRCGEYWRNGVIDVVEVDGEMICEHCREDDEEEMDED